MESKAKVVCTLLTFTQLCVLSQGKPASLAAPPFLDERSLFTKAATYGDRGDPYYHPPSSRIGSYYTPTASVACDLLEKVTRHFCLDVPQV